MLGRGATDDDVLSFGRTPPAGPLRRIALIGNALPRRCGLATFTTHVAGAMRSRYPELIVDHYAMDDGSGAAYPEDVRTIAVDDPAAYRLAAAEIEASGADVVWVQHEFGIFGGPAGEHLLGLLDRVSRPVVATLHTVLEQPSPDEKRVFTRLLERAARVIVMAELGRRILEERWDVDPARISVVPHGVPDRDQLAPDAMKPRFGLQGRDVVLTFGLLAPDKGVSAMIEAMPALVARHPDLLYIVAGATHPNLIRAQGEAYRESLIALAERLGVAANVRFIDRFLGQDELLDLLQASDLFVTPYFNMAQVTSGALSYALAVGKAIVATPYVHATEALADGHGILVPPRDPQALAAAVGALLDDPAERERVAARAYARARDMVWARFAERCAAVLGDALEGDRRPFPALSARRSALPVSFEAVERMTDGTGMFQHAIFSVPDRNHGYCIDDNARALILACRADAGEARLAPVYASFIEHAWNPSRGRFRNFMAFDRSWCEEEGSEDSNGRTLWALGVAAAEGPRPSLRAWAAHLYDRTLPMADALWSPRALAFAALGAAARLTGLPGHAESLALLRHAGERLTALQEGASRPSWRWFEAVLAYDNARLPQALIAAGHGAGRADWLEAGLAALEWLTARQTGADGSFQPVGTDSFGREYAPPLPFDQQPLEAQATVEACAAAFDITGDPRWAAEAWRAYGWFLGQNRLSLPLTAGADGGCHDGLMPHGVNGNQGAESVLALQLASVAISKLSLADGAAKRGRNAA